MEKSVIGFERVGHLLSIAATKSKSLNLQDLMLDAQGVIFSVSFSDYVKSQIHLNLVTSLFARDIYEYKYALDFIKGHAPHSATVDKILIYFYTDMLHFLESNEFDCNLEVINDVEGLSKSELKYDVVVSEFKEFYQQLRNLDFEGTYELLKDSKFAEIIDYMDNIEAVEKKPNSFFTIAYLMLLIREVEGCSTK